MHRLRSIPTLLAPLLLAIALATGCDSTAPATDAASPATAPAVTRTAALSDAPVSVIATGHWNHTLGCSGFCVEEVNFWVDLRVRNDAYDKQVGVLWTDDGWATVKTATAVYEEPLGDGWEQWGVDVTVGQMASYQAPREIEVAAFATMAGNAYWDPGNNYYIYNKVDAETPVRRLSSEVHMEPGKGVVMTGRVRVFDLAYNKEVAVRYSTDGWATWDEVEATWVSGDDWGFRAEHVADEPLPDGVEYAVRYSVDGQEYWDNSGGANFRHTLAPGFDTGYSFLDLAKPVSGVLTLGGTFKTDLPFEAVQVRVDSGAWSDGQMTTFSTAGLADGPHAVEVRATLTGGGQVTHALPFTVKNTLTPVETWAPEIESGAAVGGAWALAADGAGRIYLAPGSSWGTDAAVLRYDSWGASQPTAYAALPNQRRPQSLAVDAQGRVYAVVAYNDKAIYRFDTAGALDASFGDGGAVSLDGAVLGAPVCYAGAVTVNAHHLYLADTCQHRILRFTLDGLADGALGMPDDGSPVPAGLYADGDGVWMLRSHQIVRIDDAQDAPMSVGQVIALDPTLNGPKGLTRDADGDFWTGDGVAGVTVVGPDGGHLAGWWGGGNYDFPGAFQLPQDVVTLPNGDVAVLGAEGPRLVRFDGTVVAP